MLIRKTWDGQFVGKGDGGFYKIGGWGVGGGGMILVMRELIPL